MATRTSGLFLLPAIVAFMSDPAAAQGPESLPLRGAGQGHTARIYRGVFTPDSKTFLSAGIDKIVRAWSVPDGKPLYTLEGHQGSIHGMGLSGASLLVTGAEGGTILLWDLKERKQIGPLGKTTSALHSLVVSPNGKLAASGGGDWKSNTPGELRLWDLEKREEVHSFAGHRRLVLGVAFSPDNRLLAAVDFSGDLHVWDLVTRKPAVSLFQESPAGSVGFSPDGKHLVVGDYKGRLNVWDTAHWLDEGVALGHPGGVMFLGYAPGGKLLASAGWNGTVKMWSGQDVEAVKPLLVTEHKDKAWFAGFSPDGKTLATAGEDQLVKFWAITEAANERFTIAPPAAVQAPEPIRIGAARVAILSPQGAEAARNVQDLSLVALSDDRQITLLSRDVVEKLLKEQELSKSNLVEASSAVALGKILAVDLLAVIDAPQGKQPLGFVVFDAANGVRLHDDGFTGDKLELQARTLATGVRQAAQKWRAGTKQLKTVCFMPVRNADLPRGYDVFAEALGTTLQRQLAQHPSVATLERQWLDSVNKEQTLTTEAAARELLASVLLVQLEVSRGDKGQGFRASVVIRDNAGKVLHQFSSEAATDSGAELLDPLVQKAHQALKTAEGPAKIKRSRESRRFLREAEILWRHLHFRQAVQAAEAAYALHPNDETRVLLADYLHRYPREMWKKNPDPSDRINFHPVQRTAEEVRTGLSMVRRGHQLVDLAKSRVDELPDHQWYYSLAENNNCFYADPYTVEALQKITVRPADPDLDQEILEFRRICVARRLERLREIATMKRWTPRDRLQRMTPGISSNYLSSIESMAPDTRERLTAVRAMGRIWLELAQQVPAENFPVETARWFTDFLLHALNRPRFYGKNEPYPAQELEASLPLLEDLKKHPHPVLRLHAEHYLTKQLFELGKLSVPEAEKRYRGVVEEAKRWIDQVSFKPPDPHRVALYEFAVSALKNPPGKGFDELTDKLFEDMAEFMLQRKDVAGHATVEIALQGSVQYQLVGRKLEKVRRFLEMFNGPEHRLFHDPNKEIVRHLKNTESNLVKVVAFVNKEKPKTPWDKVVRLAEVESLPKSIRIFQAVRQDQRAYFLAANFDPAANNQVSLQLHRVNLESGPAQPLGKIAIAPKGYKGKTPEYAFSYSSEPYVPLCIIHGDWFVAGTTYDGIYLFPLGGGAPIHVGEKAGLPSQEVLGLAALEGKVFASLEHGYLVQIDLGTRGVEVLASSRRVNKLSPFDNDKPFRIWHVFADPERSRVIFPMNNATVDHPNLGTWEYSLKTGQFKKLLPVFVYGFSAKHGDVVYLEQRQPNQDNWLGRFDLIKNEFTLLQGKSPNGLPTQTPEGLPQGFHARFPVRLYHEGYVWEGSDFARKPLKGGPNETMPHPGRGYSFGIYMRQALEPIGDGRMLVGDWRGLYVLEMKKGS